ncbi:MAG: hypothetical protein ACKO6B_11220, partial [Planctomycetia bacterium]
MQRMRLAIHEAVFAAAALIAVVTPATAATVRPVPGQTDVVEMKNDLVTVRIDLAHGAKVVSFRYKGFDNEDVVYDIKADNGGLCKDLWTTQG